MELANSNIRIHSEASGLLDWHWDIDNTPELWSIRLFSYLWIFSLCQLTDKPLLLSHMLCILSQL